MKQTYIHELAEEFLLIVNKCKYITHLNINYQHWALLNNTSVSIASNMLKLQRIEFLCSAHQNTYKNALFCMFLQCFESITEFHCDKYIIQGELSLLWCFAFFVLH